MPTVLTAGESAHTRGRTVSAAELLLATVLTDTPTTDELDDELDRRIVRRIVADLVRAALAPRAA